jgi:hypothetical protein
MYITKKLFKRILLRVLNHVPENYYGFIYIWYNVISKMYYIGAHKGTINDGYKGSGKYFKRSYNKYPENFKRRILEYTYKNRQDLFEREQYWLNFINDHELTKKYYNITKVSSIPPLLIGDEHPRFRSDINIKNLIKLNKEEKLNAVEIADILNCGVTTVYDKFNEHKEDFIIHPRKPNKFTYKILEDELIYLNHIIGINYKTMSEYFGCSIHTISNRFKYYKLEYIEPIKESHNGKASYAGKLWKLYFENHFIETYELSRWCVLNNYNYSAIKNVFYGTRKSTGKNGKFGKIIKVEQFDK